jgi:3-hydroxyisobutyrate dehydrogenase
MHGRAGTGSNSDTERHDGMTAAIPDKPSIGWVGTGRMGYAMAERLLAAGHRVTVWNRTHEKAEPLSAAGASVARDIIEVTDCDVVFTMLSTPEVFLEVLEDGLLKGDRRMPALIIDSSTVSAEASARARSLVTSAGSAFLAAPVSGNPKAIAAGQLLFAVSGERHDFDAVRHILDDIGRGAYYVGTGEASRLVKLCHNLYLGLVIQSLAEVTILAQKGGVSRSAFLGFLNESAMGSVFSRYKAPALVNLDFHPTFTTALLRKDFDLGLGSARALEVPMPLTALVHQLVQAAIGQGHGEEDFASLILLQAQAAGLELMAENVDIGDGLSRPPEESIE